MTFELNLYTKHTLFSFTFSQVVSSQYSELKFSMVHKKINLAEDMLAWEHERFGIRRLPAFTLSHLSSHRLAERSSIMDVRSVSPPSRHGAGEPPAGWVYYCKSTNLQNRSFKCSCSLTIHATVVVEVPSLFHLSPVCLGTSC